MGLLPPFVVPSLVTAKNLSTGTVDVSLFLPHVNSDVHYVSEYPWSPSCLRPGVVLLIFLVLLLYSNHPCYRSPLGPVVTSRVSGGQG